MDTALPFDESDLSASFPEYEEFDASPLGRGTFKVAYLVRRNGEQRVLKVLTEPMDPGVDEDGEPLDGLPERLARELAGMSSVDSAHVVKILSQPRLVEIGPSNYLCYEEPFYSGGTLKDRIAKGPLTVAEGEKLLLCLLVAVRDLWKQQKIVHRDIKPGNIVFSALGEPVLLDLGIALYTALSDLTESNFESPKTNIYAAPEQFEARRYATIDSRTDMFQIGIVAFEAISGAHPFYTNSRMSLAEYVNILLSGEPVDVSHLKCSERTKSVLDRLLARKPNRRYRQIDEPIEILQGGK